MGPSLWAGRPVMDPKTWGQRVCETSRRLQDEQIWRALAGSVDSMSASVRPQATSTRLRGIRLAIRTDSKLPAVLLAARQVNSIGGRRRRMWRIVHERRFQPLPHMVHGAPAWLTPTVPTVPSACRRHSQADHRSFWRRRGRPWRMRNKKPPARRVGGLASHSEYSPDRA